MSIVRFRSKDALDAFWRLHADNRRQVLEALRANSGFVQQVREIIRLQVERQYEVVIPPELADRIRKGGAYFGQGSEGNLTANIHDAETGEIIGQAGLREASPDLLAALDRMGLQQSLAEIAARLERIEEKVDALLQGQEDDRIGLLASGQHLLSLASEAKHPDTRRQLLVNAVAQLSEARGRLIRWLESCLRQIDAIPTTSWGIFWTSLRRDLSKDVHQRAQETERALAGVVHASGVLALACGQLDEPALIHDSWRPLEDVIPRVMTAREKTLRWLAPDPALLPDRFSTLVTIAEQVAQTGGLLETRAAEPLRLAFDPSEFLEGE